MEKEGAPTLSPAVLKGLRKELMGDAPLSISIANWIKHKLTPYTAKELGAIAKAGKNSKLLGKVTQKIKDVRAAPLKKFYAERIALPIAKADASLGQKAMSGTEKIFGKDFSKAMFQDTKTLPMSKAKGVFTGRSEVHVPSLMAPVKKVSGVAVPVLGYMKMQELLEKRKMNKQASITKADLQKTAAMLRSLKDQRNWLEKKARATSILFKQAELGQIEFPKTASAYEEKVAELIGKNLDIVEEAIKLAAPNFNSFGSLVNDSVTGTTPQETFKQSLMTDF